MPWINSAALQEASTRLQRFYNTDEECMERDMTWRVVRAAFFLSGFVGGMHGRPEVERRLQLYTTGHNFGSPSNRIVRLLRKKSFYFANAMTCVCLEPQYGLSNTRILPQRISMGNAKQRSARHTYVH